MKKYNNEEIKTLKKGDIIHYKSFNRNIEDHQQPDVFFDAIMEFVEFSESNTDVIALCNLLVLNYCDVNWESSQVNFYIDLKEDEELYYIGPGEKFPEYFI